MRTTKNIAARAGRWSAQHRKIAIIGWLAFVIVAVAASVRAIGTKHLGNSQTSRTGESGRADAVLRSTFKRNYSEQVLVQARTGAAAKDVSRGVGDVVQRSRPPAQATNIRSPLAARQLRPALPGRALRARDVRGQGHGRRRAKHEDRQGGPAAGRHGRGGQGQSGAAHRAVRRRERAEGREQVDQRRPGEGARSCRCRSRS